MIRKIALSRRHFSRRNGTVPSIDGRRRSLLRLVSYTHVPDI